MGGSTTYHPGSTSGGTDSVPRCGGNFEFVVVIIDGTEEEVWNQINVGDDVHIDLINDVLPRLEVKRDVDDFTIGIVPASHTHLVSCIRDGWTYSGQVTNKTGDEFSPQIQVSVEGEE